MTTGWVIMALIALGHPASRDVTVYFRTEGTASTSAAKRVAATTLRRAGVNVAWRSPGRHPANLPATWLRIDLVEEDSGDRPPAVLAVSYPQAGCSKGVTVFLDRVRALASGPTQESALLGYVLAHEITHVIQGLNRHAPAGVMKARWNEADRAALFEGRLGFEAVDVQLMQNGLARGWCAEAAELRDRSGPGTAFRPE